MKSGKLRSNMRIVRGLGAAGSGVEHWWMQRLTAVALIPLSIWFVVSLLKASLFPAPEMVAEWLASPITAILLALFIIAAFIHARLGVQVVIEDYVHSPAVKYTLLIANSFLCVVLILISLLSILKLHMLDIGIIF